ESRLDGPHCGAHGPSEHSGRGTNLSRHRARRPPEHRVEKAVGVLVEEEDPRAGEHAAEELVVALAALVDEGQAWVGRAVGTPSAVGVLDADVAQHGLHDLRNGLVLEDAVAASMAEQPQSRDDLQTKPMSLA